MKRLFVLCIALIQCFIVVSTASAAAFNDVPSNHWAFNSVTQMYQAGVLNGYPDGTFKPNNKVTRAEFAKILVTSLSVPDDSSYGIIRFRDVPANHWAKQYVDKASRFLSGFDVGGELYYFPDEYAVREDIAAALVAAFGLQNEKFKVDSITRFKDYMQISEGFRKYVAIAYEHELIRGFEDGTFRPQESLTRAQVAQLIANAYELRNKIINPNHPTATPQKIPSPDLPQNPISDVTAVVEMPRVLENSSIITVKLSRELDRDEVVDINWVASRNSLITNPGQARADESFFNGSLVDNGKQSSYTLSGLNILKNTSSWERFSEVRITVTVSKGNTSAYDVKLTGNYKSIPYGSSSLSQDTIQNLSVVASVPATLTENSTFDFKLSRPLIGNENVTIYYTSNWKSLDGNGAIKGIPPQGDLIFADNTKTTYAFKGSDIIKNSSTWMLVSDVTFYVSVSDGKIAKNLGTFKAFVSSNGIITPTRTPSGSYIGLRATVAFPNVLKNDSVITVKLSRALSASEKVNIKWRATKNELLTLPGERLDNSVGTLSGTLVSNSASSTFTILGSDILKNRDSWEKIKLVELYGEVTNSSGTYSIDGLSIKMIPYGAEVTNKPAFIALAYNTNFPQVLKLDSEFVVNLSRKLTGNENVTIGYNLRLLDNRDLSYAIPTSGYLVYADNTRTSYTFRGSDILNSAILPYVNKVSLWVSLSDGKAQMMLLGSHVATVNTQTITARPNTTRPITTSTPVVTNSPVSPTSIPNTAVPNTTSSSHVVSPTTAPTATPTPRPTNTQKPASKLETMVYLTTPTKHLITCNTLAVRLKPDDAENAVGYLHGNNDNEKIVTVVSISENFAGIEYTYKGAETTGYVHKTYLSRLSDQPTTATTTPRVTGGVLTSTSSINLSPGRYTTNWEIKYNGRDVSKSSCTYNSSDPSVAYRDGDKIIAGQKKGLTIISISYAGKTTTILVNVGDFNSSSTQTPTNALSTTDSPSNTNTTPLYTSNKLSCTSSVNLSPGRYSTHWYVYYNGATVNKSSCKFVTSNSSIATIDGEKLQAGSTQGLATITISYAGEVVYMVVNVGIYSGPSTATPPFSSSLNTTQNGLTCTDSVTLTPGYKTSNWVVNYNSTPVSKSSCTFTSSDTSIATVNGDYIQAGNKNGTATITVRYSGKVGYIKVNVGNVTTQSSTNQGGNFTNAGANEYALITCDTLGVRRNPNDDETPIGYLHGNNDRENIVKVVSYNDTFTCIKYNLNGSLIDAYVHTQYLVRTKTTPRP